jgi:glycosyltransferase involved in cell wall biosynthesis
MQISIITINFNNASGLERTINSVLQQDYYDVEYIVIDGNSLDGSKAVINKYSDRLAYWISEPDTGIYNAMNKGIAKATGDYLLFLNSGDHFFQLNCLALLINRVNQQKPQQLIYGNIHVENEIPFIKKYPEILTLEYFVKDTLPHPATLIHKSCFQNNVYDSSLKIVADWKFFIIGIVIEKFSYLHVDTTIATFYMDGISSLQKALVAKERREVIKECFPKKLKQHDNYYSKKKSLLYRLKVFIKVKFQLKTD